LTWRILRWALSRRRGQLGLGKVKQRRDDFRDARWQAAKPLHMIGALSLPGPPSKELTKEKPDSHISAKALQQPFGNGADARDLGSLCLLEQLNQIKARRRDL
jgi:hypothetical protein